MAPSEGSHRIGNNDDDRHPGDARAGHPQRAGQYSQGPNAVEEQRVLPAKNSAAASARPSCAKSETERWPR